MRYSMRPFFSVTAMTLFLVVGCNSSRSGKTFRVELTRNDTIVGFSGYQFEFDQDVIAKELEKTPTKFPDPFPPDARKVMFTIGRVIGFIQPIAGKTGVLLTLDVNMNHDLTDDAQFEVPEAKSARDGAIMKLARSFSVPEPHTEWLPYRIAYEKGTGYNGKPQEDLFVMPNYRYEGGFRLGEKDYGVSLYDGDLGGHFIREKQVNVSLWVGPKDSFGKPGSGSSHRLFELIPIGESLYEIKAIAEDASWVEFEASGLSATTLGKKAPDLSMTDTQGKTFRISDYKGKVLVIDFWYVWCKPCIAKFPAIKKMIDSYSDKPLATVGVNIDKPERVEQAMKVIADNGLTWRQVVEGKAEFLPVYQVYGRLPEHPMSFPIYVAIDEEGIARYATNDFEKMGRFLEAHFRDPAGPNHFLFIPLSQYYFDNKTWPMTAIDFDSPQAKALSEEKKIKLPPDLPSDARMGRMPNGMALIVYPGKAPGQMQMVFDSDNNADLTNDHVTEIPVLNDPSPAESQMANVEYRILYKSGGMGGGRFSFFARSSGEVYFRSVISNFAGTFFYGNKEYRLELIDPNGDRMITQDDWSAPGFLKLKVKKGDSWADVHEGTSGIRIGDSVYRVRSIYDDGYLVELKKER